MVVMRNVLLQQATMIHHNLPFLSTSSTSRYRVSTEGVSWVNSSSDFRFQLSLSPPSCVWIEIITHDFEIRITLGAALNMTYDHNFIFKMRKRFYAFTIVRHFLVEIMIQTFSFQFIYLQSKYKTQNNVFLSKKKSF